MFYRRYIHTFDCKYMYIYNFTACTSFCFVNVIWSLVLKFVLNCSLKILPTYIYYVWESCSFHWPYGVNWNRERVHKMKQSSGCITCKSFGIELCFFLHAVCMHAVIFYNTSDGPVSKDLLEAYFHFILIPNPFYNSNVSF